MNIYNLIYDSHELNSNDADEDAINYARGTIFNEYDLNNESTGIYRHVDTINGVDVYYDVSADYYFFSPIEEATQS